MVLMLAEKYAAARAKGLTEQEAKMEIEKKPNYDLTVVGLSFLILPAMCAPDHVAEMGAQPGDPRGDATDATDAMPKRIEARFGTPRISEVWTYYHFNFAGMDRNFSKSSLIRSAVRFLPFAALTSSPSPERPHPSCRGRSESGCVASVIFLAHRV